MEERPRIKIHLTKWDYIIEVFSILCIVGSILLCIMYWVTAPYIVPIHYNIHGEIDNYGSKTTLFFVLLFLLVLTILTYVVFKILNKYPHIFNYPIAVTEQNAYFLYKTTTKMVRFMNLLICLLFAYSIWDIGIVGTIIQKHIIYDVLRWFLIACVVFYPVFTIVKIMRYKKKMLNK